MASLLWGEGPAAANGVPAATQRCLLPGLAASQHKLIQLPALGRLPRASKEGISFISVGQKPVEAAPGPVLVGSKQNPRSPTPLRKGQTPVPSSLSWPTPPASSASPCEQLCASSSPFQSDTWFLSLPSAPSASLSLCTPPHPSSIYTLQAYGSSFSLLLSA